MANTDDDNNRSELTDADKIEHVHYPPDRPLGAEDRGVTDVEDSVEERRRREIPSWEGSGPRDDVRTLLDQADESGIDDDPDAVAFEARRDNDPLGLGRSVQDLEEVEPAEEAAMHLTEDPPFDDDDDGYIGGSAA